MREEIEILKENNKKLKNDFDVLNQLNDSLKLEYESTKLSLENQLKSK